jgi:hypothetical protein
MQQYGVAICCFWSWAASGDDMPQPIYSDIGSGSTCFIGMFIG